MTTPSFRMRFSSTTPEPPDQQKVSLTWTRELGNKEFNSNDTRGPKSVSSFIIKLSELAPRLIIKQMTLLAKQLDSEVTLILSYLIWPEYETDDFIRLIPFDAQ